eukprot:204704_1
MTPLSSLLSGFPRCAWLEKRKILSVRGSDALKFLLGLTTNDMNAVTSPRPRESKVGVGVSTAFLTNKGRVLADVLVSCACHADDGGVDEYLLDCSEWTMPNLKRHLMMHKLRAKVEIQDRSDELGVVTAGFSSINDADSVSPSLVSTPSCASEEVKDTLVSCYQDPRHPTLGLRGIIFLDFCRLMHCDDELRAAYEAARYMQCVLEGAELEGRIPLECNMDHLRGICFKKGCYLGQELVARSHFRGKIRKRALPFWIRPNAEKGVVDYLQKDWDAHGQQSLLSGRGYDLKQITGASVINEAGESTEVGKVIALHESWGIGIMMARLEHCLDGKAVDCKVISIDDHQEIPLLPFLPSWWPR